MPEGAEGPRIASYGVAWVAWVAGVVGVAGVAMGQRDRVSQCPLSNAI